MKRIKGFIVFMLVVCMFLSSIISVQAEEINVEDETETVQEEDNQTPDSGVDEVTDNIEGEILDDSDTDENNESNISESQTIESTPSNATEPTTDQEDQVDGPLENSWRYKDGQLIQGIDNYSGTGMARSAQDTSSIVGIDVSEHQGVIDWEQVKASGMVDFVIIRCGYGMDEPGQKDDQWERNTSECERLGIPYGVYLYSYATNTTRAAREAEHVLKLVKGKNLTYPIYYDMEDDSTKDADLTAIAKTFCNAISSAGYEVGVYSYLSWWNTKLTDPVFNNWDKWVAQWNDTCTYQGDYSMWQYTSHGTVPGIKTSVDMNYWVKVKINGLTWQFRDTGIDVGVSYLSPSKDTQFRWQSYDLESKEWNLIADWNAGNWATWTPKKGNYWLHVEVKSGDKILSKTICFAVGRNYPVYISGKYQGPNPYGPGWLLGVSSNINPEQKYQYEMLILDCNKYVSGDPNPWIYGTGLARVSSGTTFWTTYNPPQGGYYWTYFRIYDENGNMIEDQCYGAKL